MILGVIESPETLKCIAALFTKTIIWYLLKHSFSPSNVQKKRLVLSKKTEERKYFVLEILQNVFIKVILSHSKHIIMIIKFSYINAVGSQRKTKHDDTNVPSLETQKNSDVDSPIEIDQSNNDVIGSENQQDDAVISFNPGPEEIDNEISYYQPIEQILRPSSSIEAVNLNSWPTSSTETSPEQQKDKLGEY